MTIPRQLSRGAAPVEDAPHIAQAVSHDVDYNGLLRLAESLVPTGFLPEHIKQPGQAVAIILAGRELGMMPMQALRSLRMVKGNVTEAADSQLARFKQDGGRARWVRLDEEEAVLHLIMRNGDEVTSTFTMKDADRAGLTKPDRNGGPSMYHKFPKALLRSRAITQGMKDLGWSGGVGVYDPAELVGVIDVPEPRGRALTSGDVARIETEQVHRAYARAAEVQRPAHVTEDGEDTSARGPMTLEQAASLPIYGRPDRWNGHGGKPLGQVPADLIDSARTFFRGLLEKDPHAANAARLREQVEAMDLVNADWDAMRAAEAAAQTDAFDASDDTPADPDPEPAPAPDVPETPALPEDRNRWSAAQLQAYVLQQLNHPAIGEAFARQMRLIIETGATKAELVLAEADLASMITNAPPLGGRGTAPKRTRTSSAGVTRPS
ncbi:MAG: hypothetical protein ABJA80_01945 [bacterium]